MSHLTDKNLFEILDEGAFVPRDTLEQAQTVADQTNRRLEQVVIEKEILTDLHLGQIIANEFRMPFINMGDQSISADSLHLLPEAFAVNNAVICFKNDEQGIHIALHNPEDAHLIQLLEKRLGKNLVFHYATLNGLHQAFHTYRSDLDEKISTLADKALNKAHNSSGTQQDSEVIEIVDLLLEYAYNSKASDLHFEPQEVDTVVRFRVDGVLADRLFLPKKLHDRVVTRLKILAHLQTDEHFAAQDGHLSYHFGNEKVDIRLSILPTTFGEKIVMRLLSEKARQFSLEELGLTTRDFDKLKKQARKPWGMVLVTGPTGSGKTTSLYAVLKVLNQRNVNISTIEDPVEYSISGVNQIQVNPKTNLTFAEGLRSIVRQDPDIIMVGEIRDEETSGISINAALTGHLVLSTLHTNDAATALPRLLDMGVEPFLVASTVNVVVAQRLVRRICSKCISSYEISLEELESKGYFVPETVKERMFSGGSARLYRGAGCDACHNGGFSGRTGVFEVLEIDSTIRKMILEHQSSDVIRTYAIENGMTSMFQDALSKVEEGKTTIEEILRVVRE